MLTRIAPTPSGYLHLGNLFNFMLTWIRARQQGIPILLRIDDADSQRKRIEYLEDIFKTLDWLGIDWNEGPTSVDDFEKKWSQRFRLTNHEALLDKLLASNSTFQCACSRSTREITNQCNCLEHPPSPDQPGALKIKIPIEPFRFLDTNIGPVESLLTPFVIRQKNGMPSYQVSSLADDRDFQITHIFRGQDLLDSTVRQLYLDLMVGESGFQQIKFHHHSLIRDKNGEKLSKSAGAQSQSIRDQYSRIEIFKAFAEWQEVIGNVPETMNLWLSVPFD
jgi:glutamyl-tRNA synthetase